MRRGPAIPGVRGVKRNFAHLASLPSERCPDCGVDPVVDVSLPEFQEVGERALAAARGGGGSAPRQMAAGARLGERFGRWVHPSPGARRAR
jgi:hypothetical protein